MELVEGYQSGESSGEDTVMDGREAQFGDKPKMSGAQRRKLQRRQQREAAEQQDEI